jgi:hypothetical protein
VQPKRHSTAQKNAHTDVRSESRAIVASAFPRAHGDIQTAVVALVDRLAPVVPVARQPYVARKIAEVIACRPSSMGNDMFVRQSIIRGGTATRAHVIGGLAAWVTVLHPRRSSPRKY